jgi:hypothetical protein
MDLFYETPNQTDISDIIKDVKRLILLRLSCQVLKA